MQLEHLSHWKNSARRFMSYYSKKLHGWNHLNVTTKGCFILLDSVWWLFIKIQKRVLTFSYIHRSAQLAILFPQLSLLCKTFLSGWKSGRGRFGSAVRVSCQLALSWAFGREPSHAPRRVVAGWRKITVGIYKSGESGRPLVWAD